MEDITGRVLTEEAKAERKTQHRHLKLVKIDTDSKAKDKSMEIQELAKGIVRELIISGALVKAINSAVASNPITPTPTPPTTGNFTPDQKLRFGLRGDVMNLMERIVEKHGIDKKIIFGELKKRTGVSQPEATPAQLSERIDLLQIWLETGRL